MNKQTQNNTIMMLIKVWEMRYEGKKKKNWKLLARMRMKKERTDREERMRGGNENEGKKVQRGVGSEKKRVS